MDCLLTLSKINGLMVIAMFKLCSQKTRKQNTKRTLHFQTRTEKEKTITKERLAKRETQNYREERGFYTLLGKYTKSQIQNL